MFLAEVGVAAHLNTEGEMLLTGIPGEGMVTVDGEEHRVEAAQTLVIAHLALLE